MNRTDRISTRRMGFWRWGAIAVCCTALTAGVGCEGDELRDTFRGAALDSFKSGFNSFLGGFSDGLFAVLELGLEEDQQGAGGTTVGGNSEGTSETTTGG